MACTPQATQHLLSVFWQLSKYAVRCHASIESANLHAAAAICCGAMDGMRCANDVSA
jgi:hypothetical protein